VTMCHWVSSSWCEQGLQCHHLQGQGVFLDFQTLKKKALHS